METEQEEMKEFSTSVPGRRPSRPLKNVDDLYNLLGDPGRFQVLAFIFLACHLLCVSPTLALGVFLGYSPPHSCHADDGVPENRTNQTIATYRACSTVLSSDDQNANITLACEVGQWKYDVKHGESSAVTEWDLVCGRHYLAHLQSTLHYLGVMVGALTFGHISDLFGRRLVSIVTLHSMLLIGLGIVFSESFILFTLLRVAMGVVTQGLQTNSYVQAVELFPVHHRSLAGTVFQVFWGFGMLMLSGVAWLLPNWRHAQLALMAPVLLAGLLVWFLPESLRWLLARGKTRPSMQVVQRIARFNSIALPPHFNHESFLEDYKVHSVHGHAGYIDLVRTPVMRRRLLILVYLWFAMNTGYWGLTYISSYMAGDRHLNFFLGACTETVAYCFGVYAVTRFGRKRTLVMFFLGGTVCCIVAGTIPVDSNSDRSIAVTVFSVLGKFCMGGLFSCTDLYTAELLPTVLRNTGAGVCCCCGRVGALVTPQLYALRAYTFTQLPPLLFAAISLAGALLTLLLPETRGQHLPDTVKDVEESFGWLEPVYKLPGKKISVGTDAPDEKGDTQGNPSDEETAKSHLLGNALDSSGHKDSS